MPCTNKPLKGYGRATREVSLRSTGIHSRPFSRLSMPPTAPDIRIGNKSHIHECSAGDLDAIHLATVCVNAGWQRLQSDTNVVIARPPDHMCQVWVGRGLLRLLAFTS